MNLFDSVVAGKLAGGGSGGGGGGVGDLLIKTGSDTLTWDGNTDGLVCVADVYYKVSDNIVTSADWPNGIRVNFAGVFYEIPPTGMIELSEGAFFSEVATFITESAVGIDIQGRVFPESGVYFTAIGDQYTSSLTIPGYDGFNKKEIINPKYLPETGGGVSSWNDLTDKPFGEEDNAVLLPPTQFAFDDAFGLFAVPGYIPFLEGKTYTVNWNGVEYTTEGVPGQFNGEDLVMIGNPAALGGANNNLPFTIACLMGSIGAIPLDGSTSVNVGIKGYLLAKIPLKYMPRMVVTVYSNDVMPESGSVPATIKTPGVTRASILDAVMAGGDVVIKLYDKLEPSGYSHPRMCYFDWANEGDRIAVFSDLNGYRSVYVDKGWVEIYPRSTT